MFILTQNVNGETRRLHYSDYRPGRQERWSSLWSRYPDQLKSREEAVVNQDRTRAGVEGAHGYSRSYLLAWEMEGKEGGCRKYGVGMAAVPARGKRDERFQGSKVGYLIVLVLKTRNWRECGTTP